MELSGARVLVCGATGVLGGAIARALSARGARVVPAGRNPGRLAEVAQACGHAAIPLDVVDESSCRAAVQAASEALGGLDGLVVATGVAAFGPAVEADGAVTEELFAVNTFGPMTLVRAAAPLLSEGGFVAVLSAILADLPTNGMAEYSASKSALSAWLGVVRRENRRRFTVLDIRPPHIDTGLADRALAGSPPPLPEGFSADEVVDAVLRAVESGAREVVFEPKTTSLQVR